MYIEGYRVRIEAHRIKAGGKKFRRFDNILSEERDH